MAQRGGHQWFWELGDEKHIFSVNHLIDVYKKSVGRNATLIIGLTPDNRGLMPQPDIDTLAAFNNAVNKLFGNPIAGLKTIGKKMELEVPKGKKANYIVLGEDLQFGQRVRSFQIQVKQKGSWQTAFQGSSIGNKFIYQFPTESTFNRVRLIINEAVEKPLISKFELY